MESENNESLLEKLNFNLRPANFFQVLFDLVSRNSISIWLPETIVVDNKGIFHAARGESCVEFRKFVDHTDCYKNIQDTLELNSSIRTTDFGFELKITLTNLTKNILRNVECYSCIQLAASPDFRYDIEENIYWYSTNGWDKFTVTRLANDGLMAFIGHKGVPKIPLIVVESTTSTYAIGLIFKGAQKVSGNIMEYINCIHSNNNPPEDIKPKGELIRQGRLFIHRNGKDAILRLAQEFIEDSQ